MSGSKYDVDGNRQMVTSEDSRNDDSGVVVHHWRNEQHAEQQTFYILLQMGNKKLWKPMTLLNGISKNMLIFLIRVV